MDRSIMLSSEQGKPVWVVHTCGMVFSFSDQQSATSFATKLEERVRAPHALSPEICKHWAAEQARILRGW
ncbi:hypothetical protein [Pseudomonas sp. NPDC089569]|uniref:hypothetical protein n=1 Tax=Pseudomonas sp. NPDC089569 TaxID=3390722 RepID=UPI003D06B907